MFMDWIGILIVILGLAAAILIVLYGLTAGFGAWGRSLPGRLVLGALSGVVLASLSGAMVGALAQNNPWAPTYQKVGFWEAVSIYSLTWGMFAGVPAAVVGAIIGLIIWSRTRPREK
jgi:hypothetical protein